MSQINLNSEILSSFLGTFFALLSAGILWIIKSAYEKHARENLALSKFERMCSFNLTALKDNLIFIEQWATSAKNNRLFSYMFEKLLINEEETYKLSDLKLINRILSINYMAKRMNNDLENIYKSYWDTIIKIDSLPDDKKEVNLQAYNRTITATLDQMKLNYSIAEKGIKEIVAHIRVLAKVKKHSLFGYIKIIFTDIFPRFTEESFKNETEKLESEIAQKMLNSK